MTLEEMKAHLVAEGFVVTDPFEPVTRETDFPCEICGQRGGELLFFNTEPEGRMICADRQACRKRRGRRGEATLEAFVPLEVP